MPHTSHSESGSQEAGMALFPPEASSHTSTMKSRHYRETEGWKVVRHKIIEHLKETRRKVMGRKNLGEEIIHFQVRNCSDILKCKGNQIVANKRSWAHHSVFAWGKTLADWQLRHFSGLLGLRLPNSNQCLTIFIV